MKVNGLTHQYRSKVIDELEAEFRARNVAVVYVYFDFANQARRAADQVVRSLLRQVASHVNEMTPEIYALYDKLRLRGHNPELSQLVSALLSVTKQLVSTFIVLDALDECKEDKLEQLIRMLKWVSEESVHLYATSRPHLRNLSSFFNAPAIPIVADVRDVEAYLINKVSEKNPSAQEFNNSIVNTLAPRANGMYVLLGELQ